MPADLTRKTDSVAPIPFTLTDGGSPVDLTTATGVTLFMSDSMGTLVVNGASTVVDTDPTTGIVVWTPLAADVDTPGIYDIEFEVNWNDGTNTKFPGGGYTTLRLVQDLEP